MGDIYLNGSMVPSVTTIGTVTDAIKLKTDNLPSDPADESNQTALHTIPGKNVATNTNMRDVIGNKTDDEDGDSLYAFAYITEKHFHGRRYMYPFNKAGVSLVASGTAWTNATNTTTIIGAIQNVDVAAAVNAGGGLVRIPATGHGLEVGTYVRLSATTNYNNVYEIIAKAANTFDITATYVAENFTAAKFTAVIPSPFDIHWINVTSVSNNGDYEIIVYKGAIGAELVIGRCSFTKNASGSGEASISFMTELLEAETRISARLNGSNAAANTAVIKIGYHIY